MKSIWMAILPALAAASLLTGCSESPTDSSSPAAGESMSKAVNSAAGAVSDTAKNIGNEAAKAADTTSDQLRDVTKAAQDAAASAGAAAQQKFNDLVAEIKRLISEGKGTEAVQKLESAFANVKLTPDQQKIVDDLKTQLQNAVAKPSADSATKAASDALKPKP